METRNNSTAIDFALSGMLRVGTVLCVAMVTMAAPALIGKGLFAIVAHFMNLKGVPFIAAYDVAVIALLFGLNVPIMCARMSSDWITTMYINGGTIKRTPSSSMLKQYMRESPKEATGTMVVFLMAFVLVYAVIAPRAIDSLFYQIPMLSHVISKALVYAAMYLCMGYHLFSGVVDLLYAIIVLPRKVGMK